jgi:uncharacterized membrane protein
MMDGAPPQDPGDTAPPPPPPSAPPPPADPPPVDPPSEEPTEPAGGATSDNRTLWVVLSYLGVLALIPLLVEKDDAEVQWHAKHGLVLTVAELGVLIVLAVVVFVITSVTGIGCLGCFLWVGLSVAFTVIHVLCIVKGIKGERFLIPGISEFADKF